MQALLFLYIIIARTKAKKHPARPAHLSRYASATVQMLLVRAAP
jgi:hypothetical protein